MDNLNYKQVIIVRKDLNMRKGKMVAQGSHASQKALSMKSVVKEIDGVRYQCVPLDDMNEPWLLTNFKKVVVSVSSEDELLSIYEKSQNLGLYSSLIQDSGLTEFGGIPTFTAVAVGPAPAHLIDPITGNLPLI